MRYKGETHHQDHHLTLLTEGQEIFYVQCTINMASHNREGAKNSGGKRAGLLPAQVYTGNAGHFLHWRLCV